MSGQILCSNCQEICPQSSGIKKRYFTTTQYAGQLCSISCCVSWITNCRIKKIKPRLVDISTIGTFKTVCSRVSVSSKI